MFGDPGNTLLPAGRRPASPIDHKKVYWACQRTPVSARARGHPRGFWAAAAWAGKSKPSDFRFATRLRDQPMRRMDRAWQTLV